MATKSKTQDARYTMDLHIRLTPEERDKLLLYADRHGVKVSVAGRLLLRKNLEAAVVSEKVTEKEARRRSVLACQSVRTDFRKIAADYANFLSLYRESCRVAGPYRDEGIMYAIGALQDLTLSLQRSVNRLLAHFGIKEVRDVVKDPQFPSACDSPVMTSSSSAAAVVEDASGSESRRGLPGTVSRDEASSGSVVEGWTPSESERVGVPLPGADAVGEAASEMLNIILHYMEQITIMGNVLGDVTCFKAKNGTEYMRFVVSVKGLRGGRPYKTDYSVIRERSDAMAQYITSGSLIVVSGDLSVDMDARTCTVYANTVKFTQQQ